MEKKIKIWIDIDNTPHVLFFIPIIKELKYRECDITITARNYGGILQLLDDAEIKYTQIGKDYGKNKINKILGTLKRILQLYFFIIGKRINISVSHGSRTHVGASWLARIPSITSYDYEFSSKFLINKMATKIIIPKLIYDEYQKQDKLKSNKITYYEGLKEQIYLKDFLPDINKIPEEFIKYNQSILVLIRPPATRAHYYSTRSQYLFLKLLELLKTNENLFLIFSPRDKKQKHELTNILKNYSKYSILEREYDGLSMIWYSDIVISGGGTMNREASLLGVPVYSIFGGKIGAIDKELEKIGRLTFLNSDIKLEKIIYKKRDKKVGIVRNNELCEKFVDEILKLIK